MQQEEHETWQAFCAATVHVMPSEAAPAGAQEAVAEGEQQLYQHRLPQLGDRLQRLLAGSGIAWQQHAQGTLPTLSLPSVPSHLLGVLPACLAPSANSLTTMAVSTAVMLVLSSG